jgi:hypothetical protein
VNKDKRATLQVLADITNAYRHERSLPHKVVIVLHDAVRRMADSEALSLKKMEPYKDNEGTARNYRNAANAVDDLTEAYEAIADGDLDQAWAHLARVASPPTEKPEPVKTRKAKR